VLVAAWLAYEMNDDRQSGSAAPHEWFDAHLDLAFLAETGRDMHASPAKARGRYTPVAVTLPEMRAGGVRSCLATVFTEPVHDPQAPDAETGAFAYHPDDGAGAYVAGMRQLKLYQAWANAGLIELMPVRGSAWGEPMLAAVDAPLRVGVLLEGADPIESPDDLSMWVAQGVIAIGLAWREGSRYAGGDAPDAFRAGGLTDMGRDLVRAADAAGVVHDLSHLSDQALDDVLSLSSGAAMVSHTNCRALLDGHAQRFVTDDIIAEVARRGGVIGVTLLSSFLVHPYTEKRAPIDAVCDHIEHICTVAGHRRAVGLGSDIDGGVSAHELPAGITTIADLGRITDVLRTRGWSESDLAGFVSGNWNRFWSGVE
jgi:membrane dipeptidase